MADALVLAGALMKGPFAAGACALLTVPIVRARLGLDIRCIVAASSGALSAAYLAHCIHAGTEDGAGARLAKLWVERATLTGSIAPSVRAILARRGLSSAAKLLRTLRENIRPRAGCRPIALRLIVTNMDGEADFVGGARATAHERVVAFNGDDFADGERLERLFRTVAASAAFPGVFEPVTLDLGARRAECVDGGATDNAPVRVALDADPEITRVFIISPNPRVTAARRSLRGLAYLTRLADILIEERLVRDLREAEQANDALSALAEAIPDADTRRRVLRALGWSRRRKVQVIEIRPIRPLRGNAFSGWFSRRLRAEYVQAGVDAAARTLEPLAAAASSTDQGASLRSHGAVSSTAKSAA